MKHQVSKLLAVVAMILLLIHIADGSMERIINHGFLPASLDKNSLGLSNFGVFSIVLFFLAFAVNLREKRTSKITTILLLVGGGMIGTTALAIAAIGVKTGMFATLLTVSVSGYGIMISGVFLRSIQQKREAKTA